MIGLIELRGDHYSSFIENRLLILFPTILEWSLY